MSLSKDLENLKYVKDVFSQLAAGRHIDASADAEWWNALQGEYKDDYAILFKHLGKKLEIDPRGFAYFNFDEDANQKAAQQVALLFLLILDKKYADGADLLRFTSWNLDPVFFAELREKNKELLVQEKLDSDEAWNRVVHKAETLGFINKDDSCYTMMLPCWRFIDLYQELSDGEAEDTAVDNDANEDSEDFVEEDYV
ncbi:hypothetical protein [Fibrobacter succinogenes]|uniref:condensin complex protein MksE n=1 Tax=Fibrobacter succinogenes TaxID=833 RepID=UPI0015644BAA|nr:hypothetical protein [Fibrobacter succinogenes]